ncbi:siderophore-interacting protein [Devosia pacifica]|uniref:Siderophore-interacting protein n=1 Tax=Devosia pacifica TaxID=1335967 RepID=A0A918VSR9_9HYPH|nr:siderophore-interacting protein [Devosia pacifica]GHA25655.1 siderophore-interacting protein [Devosia pacifica]
MPAAAPDRTLKRLRHDIRVRQLDVAAIEDLTPKMRRITLAGPDLEGFDSPGHADHIKMFFSPDPDNPILPEAGPQGLAFPEGQRPQMRDYTPRAFDAQRLRLDIDFVLHGDEGPASAWASQARIGQKAVIAGPRGSLIVPMTFDWYLLAGDETGLPAIARRLEELPSGAPVIAVLEVADAAEEQVFETQADLALHWVHRNGAAPGTTRLISQKLTELEFPKGDAYAFIASEANASRAAKAHLVDSREFNPEWVKAAGYWLHGVADAQEPH